ncbi:SDR family NAD(P)-dependent oxidoreductase [Saccharothrix algeriensis]|uniref:NAD(P)-dependent dehydrogenase (Short-subunit alcohol dehydrogenase family) n=1 Tax=Saccharothrix algeriensis TaxID=173560 RepID=A0A8T8I161_9PSEU|nr:SDR family oxidoreductase [Saccharothrix algeriensis]MBM7810401.1 NAD(P)-dependent dehydrogenase (short-subunit alcohol dehydrogenase family) [Saccharothrix algeriensis]QTR04532.1 SDR family oxidoreductase [Saccharothrix algeriensis]
MTSARTVLVTGGAGGIGRAIATAFATLGDNVVIADVGGVPEAAAALGVRGVTADITDEGSISRALDEVGPVDVLVNNAGLLSVHGRLLELPAADMFRILQTNVHGTFLMTQQVARRMVERGVRGAVVNLSSIGGRQPTPGMGGYESSKAAVDALTRWAAVELAEHGIRVNAVAPGPVLTPMLAAGMPEGSPAREAWVSRIPLRQMAAVEDVAAAVVFLAGDGAAHITGTSLPVDGGQLLT